VEEITAIVRNTAGGVLARAGRMEIFINILYDFGFLLRVK